MGQITLTDEQAGAVTAIKDWFNSIDSTFKTTFVLGGYAGTGKTTLVNFIVDDLKLEENDIRYVAYTGKAAMVLRKKGLPATTIHGLIYRPRIDEHGKVTFCRRSFVELEKVKLIICDESSMVGNAIKSDLESFGIPVLYIGDCGQLPPVSKDQINLMAYPDYVLNTIHRQALDNPIIRLAHAVRMGEDISFGMHGDSCFVLPWYRVQDEYLLSADQVICGFNNTRKKLNSQIRELMGFKSDLPEPGDKLICLKNSNEAGLVNGMMGTCVSYDSIGKYLGFTNDDGVGYECLDIDDQVFLGGEVYYQRGIEQFDFGYAVTAHKYQGSEAPKVLVFEELFGSDTEQHRRWRYTAITRASEKLMLIR